MTRSQLRTSRTAGQGELPEPVPLLGTWVHPVTLPQAVAVVAAWARSKRAALVVTPNVDHAVMLESNSDLREAYASARLRLCDGQPLLTLSRLVGRPLPARVTGADLFLEVCRTAAQDGLRVFVAGGMPDVLERGLAALRHRFPGLDIVGHSPPLHFEGSEHDLELQERIRAAAPQVVMVCLGAPRAELWAARQQHRYAAVYLCVGAAIDFAAGARRRAPVALQRAGLEWLYRLAQEPRRLARRYLVQDRAFVRLAYRELAASRKG